MEASSTSIPALTYSATCCYSGGTALGGGSDGILLHPRCSDHSLLWWSFQSRWSFVTGVGLIDDDDDNVDVPMQAGLGLTQPLSGCAGWMIRFPLEDWGTAMHCGDVAVDQCHDDALAADDDHDDVDDA